MEHVQWHEYSVHPSSITVASYIEPRNCGTSHRAPRPDQFLDNSHNGKISPQARRKITKAIDIMIYLAKPGKMYDRYHGKHYKFLLPFITLTLSSDQVHSDQEIKRRCLKPFLRELKRKWHCERFLCRAEKQKNGRIHFHILTDRWIPWQEGRNVWNRCQEILGYVTNYRRDRELWHRDGFTFNPDYAPRWDRATQLKAYKEGLRTDWDNPNSFDIHDVKHVGNLKRYLVKYLTKHPDSDEKLTPDELEKLLVSGRLWSCSENLSNLPGGRGVVDEFIAAELEKIESVPGTYVIHERYYSVYFFDARDLEALGCAHLLKSFLDYIAGLRSGSQSQILF